MIYKQGDLGKKIGATKTRRCTSRQVCRDCNGDGTRPVYRDKYEEGDDFTICPTCDGEGLVIVELDINVFPWIRKRKATL
jgi:DnaJ-class molecular chaperone